MDGLCCSPVLKRKRKILFKFRNENITFGRQYQFTFADKIALQPTRFSPIGKGVLSLKENHVCSTAIQGVEQVLYCRRK